MQQHLKKEIIVSWRDYYDVRNNLRMMLCHYRLCALYQTLYMMCYYIWKLSKEKRIVYIDAIKDAWLNRDGKHKVYKPGWQIVLK